MKIISLKLSATVCYLIPVEDKYLLIDTGYERDKALFHKKLVQLGIHITDIAYVLLTHHHDDHAGLIKEIKDLNPSCSIIMHVNALPFLKKGKNDMTHGKYVNKRIARLMKMIKKVNKEWDFTFPAYTPQANDIIIEEDTRLRHIGIDIPGKIIYTPGHTNDSITLLLDNGSCIVGDAASNMLQIMGTRYCVIIMNDLEVYYKSWEKLMACYAKTIYPAHGKPFHSDKLRKYLHKNKEKYMVHTE